MGIDININKNLGHFKCSLERVSEIISYSGGSDSLAAASLCKKPHLFFLGRTPHPSSELKYEQLDTAESNLKELPFANKSVVVKSDFLGLNMSLRTNAAVEISPFPYTLHLVLLKEWYDINQFFTGDIAEL